MTPLWKFIRRRAEKGLPVARLVDMNYKTPMFKAPDEPAPTFKGVHRLLGRGTFVAHNGKGKMVFTRLAYSKTGGGWQGYQFEGHCTTITQRLLDAVEAFDVVPNNPTT